MNADKAAPLRVAVVGAGVGGLAASVSIAAKGHLVTLYEAHDAVGGKMRRVPVEGAEALDGGPTVLTMRAVFDRLFSEAGQSFDDLVQLRALDRLARHAWTDGTRFDLYADEARNAEAIRETFGARDADGYLRFCAHAKRIYERVEGPFIFADKPGVGAAWRDGGLGALFGMLGVDWHRSMWKALGSFFASPQLRQLFGRYATYYGSSPYAAPATLNLIAEVERAGVWTVQGGIHQLAQALADVALGLGAEIRLNSPVREILVEGGRATGVVTDRGPEGFDAVVFNGAVEALLEGHLGAAARAAVRRRREPPRSLSALTWCMATPASGFDLDFHNVFFSDDYAAEFEALFKGGGLPAEPTVYVCAQDRDGGPQPKEERIFILANAPARGDEDQPDASAIESCQRATFELLQRCGLELGPPERATLSSPSTFEALFPATGGALYGPATHGPFAAFSRPTARTRIPGLYVAGGTTHPGAGVPMVAQSGQLAAEAIQRDWPKLARRSRALASSSTSPTAATPGGTSTP